jgi:hypothetical protein
MKRARPEMKDEIDKKAEEQHAEDAYEAPKVIRVSLRPDEAVLGHCKVTGAAGPVSGSCRSVVSCRSIGS